MNEQALLHNWSEQKLTHNFRRLRNRYVVEYEFIRQPGHPSSYAFVKFEAEPAEQASLEFDVDWPSDFDVIYTTRIKNSIAEAVLDTLWSSKTASRGCKLRLVDFKWYEVGGSEVAVHAATQKALQRLILEAEWDQVTGRYRSYDV
jgi:hypothetical protein